MVIRLAQPWNLFSFVEPPRSLVEPLNPPKHCINLVQKLFNSRKVTKRIVILNGGAASFIHVIDESLVKLVLLRYGVQVIKKDGHVMPVKCGCSCRRSYFRHF